MLLKNKSQTPCLVKMLRSLSKLVGMEPRRRFHWLKDPLSFRPHGWTHTFYVVDSPAKKIPEPRLCLRRYIHKLDC